MLDQKRTDLRNVLNIGIPSEPEPQIPLSVYTQRLKKLQDMMKQNDVSTVIIYGDREHFANIMYFTGFDPRFEEALLIINSNDTEIKVLVGNEGLGFSRVIAGPHKKILFSPFSPFSLAGQPLDSTPDLKSILKDHIPGNHKIGLVGWKPLNLWRTEKSSLSTIPYVIVHELMKFSKNNCPVDVTDFMMHPQYGLRSCLEIEQLAKFEWVATLGSESMFRALLALKPGQSEFEIASNLQLNGYPVSYHIGVASGERLGLGGGSPSGRRVQTGEALKIGFGLRGSNVCRVGFLVSDKVQLLQDYYEKVTVPYFKAIGHWYQNFHIDAKAGELHKVVHRELSKPFFNIGLNAGHQIDNEEWMNSPVCEDGTVALRSGNYYQCDFFPSAQNGYYGIFAEDGAALLDLENQQKFASKYPEAFSRIQRRKANMTNILNIKVSADMMPFSNICGFVFPYLYDLNNFPSF